MAKNKSLKALSAVDLRYSFKKNALKFLTLKPVNSLVRSLKPISRYSPDLFTKLPVNTVFSVSLPGDKQVSMVGRGGSVENILYWTGFDGFEKESVLLFIALSKQSRTILDIGANSGYYSLIASLYNPDAQIFAFEPVAKVFETIKDNIDLNGLTNVRPLRYAISDSDGEIDICIPDGPFPTSASINPSKSYTYTETVASKTVDSFCRENAVTGVDLIKMDVEGLEDKAIASAAQTIEKDRPFLIAEVLSNVIEGQIQQVMSGHDYIYYFITPEGLVRKESIEADESNKYRNYLFVPREKIEQADALSPVVAQSP